MRLWKSTLRLSSHRNIKELPIAVNLVLRDLGWIIWLHTLRNHAYTTLMYGGTRSLIRHNG